MFLTWQRRRAGDKSRDGKRYHRVRVHPIVFRNRRIYGVPRRQYVATLPSYVEESLARSMRGKEIRGIAAWMAKALKAVDEFLETGKISQDEAGKIGELLQNRFLPSN